MKKLLILISILVTFNAYSQNTTTLPTPTTSYTPSYRYYGTLLDSLRQTWIQVPSGGWNRFYSATEANLRFELLSHKTSTVTNSTTTYPNGYAITQYAYPKPHIDSLSLHFIKNGISFVQDDANFWIDGTGKANTFEAVSIYQNGNQVANDNAVVKLVGNQTILNNKTFNNRISAAGGMVMPGDSGLTYLNNGYQWDQNLLSDGSINWWMHGTGMAAFNFLTTNNGEISDNLGIKFTKDNQVNTATATALNSQNLQAVASRGDTTNTRLKAKYFVSSETNTGLYDSIVVVNGNSIETGNAAISPASSWPQLMSQRTRTSLTNFAISGTTLVQHSAGDSSAIERINRIVPLYTSKMRAIISGYGINDALNIGGTLDTAAFRAAYYTYIAKCVSQGWPTSKVYLFIPYNNNANGIILNNLIKNICLVKSTVFIPIRDSMIANGGSSLLAADATHPTTKGHILIAKWIAPAIGGSQYNYDVFNNDVTIAGRLNARQITTTDLYSQYPVNDKGLLTIHGDVLNTKSESVTKNITLGYGRTGSQTQPDYLYFNGQYTPNELDGTNLQMYLYGTQASLGTGIGVSQIGGLGLYSNAGGNRITMYNTTYLKQNMLFGASGATTTPNYIGTDPAGYINAAITNTNTVFRGYNGSGMGFSSVDGVALIAGSGLTQLISLKNNTTVAGTITATGNASFGSTLTGSQATPSKVSTGSSFSSTPGVGPKFDMGNGFGIGVSSGSFDNISIGDYNWYTNATVKTLSLSNLGRLTLQGLLQLKAGTTTVAAMNIPTGSLLTTPVSGSIEFDGTELYYTNTTGRRTVANLLTTQTFGPNKIFQTPTGTVATDSITVKLGSTGKFGAVATDVFIKALATNSATTTVTNTTTETTLIPTVTGSTTLPIATAGKQFRVVMGGVYSTPAITAGTLTINVYYGGTLIATGTASGLLAGASNLAFSGNLRLSTLTVGASGTITVDGGISYSVGNNLARFVLDLNNTGNSVTVANNATAAFDVKVQWDTASASKIVKCTQFSLEQLN
jgi:hypothetical protein